MISRAEDFLRQSPPSLITPITSSRLIILIGLQPCAQRFSADQVKEAGQQLLVGEVAGRAKQDDDLRQLGAYPRRYLRHGHPHRRPLIPR